jgi:hypothetical protein
VLTWSDTQIMAKVAASALSGIARVQQGDISSNTMTFTVLGSGSTAATMAPNQLKMVVGETRTIQALSAASQPVTGLTWTSSDPAVVSLSSDDPGVITALTAGHVTITAGAASADVTVSADALPVGTVIWSNPGNGSGVTKIVPAVPSASGVADVFAFQGDGTVQAITSDGATAWTADVSQAWWSLPDFQGGLIVVDGNGIRQLNGTTGQAHSVYSLNPNDASLQLGDFFNGNSVVAIHTDGTVFALSDSMPNYPHTPLIESVVGLDSTTGAQKF